MKHKWNAIEMQVNCKWNTSETHAKYRSAGDIASQTYMKCKWNACERHLSKIQLKCRWSVFCKFSSMQVQCEDETQMKYKWNPGEMKVECRWHAGDMLVTFMSDASEMLIKCRS